VVRFKKLVWLVADVTPVILATQEAEIRRITVWGQPGQIVHETLSGKNPSQKRAGGVAQGVGPKFKPQYPPPHKTCVCVSVLQVNIGVFVHIWMMRMNLNWQLCKNFKIFSSGSCQRLPKGFCWIDWVGGLGSEGGLGKFLVTCLEAG
jgi:hypothetical protein